MEDISAVDEVDVISRQSAQDADPFPNEPAFATRLAERAKDAQPEPAAVAPVAPRRAYAEAAVGPSQPITQYQEANAAGAPLGDFLQAIRTTEHFGGAHIEPAPRPNILVASTSASDIKTGVSETPGAQQHVMRARGRKTFGGFERPRSNPLAGTPRVEHHRLVPFWEPDGEDEPESSADPNLDARPSSALPPRRKAGRASVAGPVMRAEPSSSTNMIGPPRPFTSPTRRSLPVSRVAVSARPLYATAKSAQKMRRIEDWTSLMSAELATSGLSDVDEAEEITLRGKATKGTTPRGSRPRAGLQELGPLAATPSPVRVRPRPKSTPAGRASEGARSPAQPEKNKGKEKARTPEEIARAKASYQAKVSELCHEYGLSAPAQAVPFLQPVAGDLKLGRARLEAYVRKLAEENGVERDLIVDFLREAGGVWAEAKRYVALIKRQRERRGG